MELEIPTKLTVANDGTNWFLMINSRPMRPKFKSKEAADVYLRCMKTSIIDILAEVSERLEK